MTRRTLLGLVLAACALGAGCGSADAPRFTHGPAVTRVADDAPIPTPPERGFHRLSYILDNYTLREMREMTNLDRVGPALDANRFGEVPASSWYAGVEGRLDPAEIARGVGGDDPGPEAHLPWSVTGLKIGGRNPGFVFEDARGRKYICKFDKHGAPVISTAAGAVAPKLFWALGYHVPDDRVVIFDRDDLHVDPEATTKNALGEKRALHEADIDTVLAALPSRTVDGRFRALVSAYLPGLPRGGFALSGVNGDDPNDRIPHQDRRSLRALRVFGAWLQHVDLKEDNTLDLYVGEDGTGHLRHYLVDFDGCLGGYWAARGEKRIGHAYDLDWREFWGGLLGLGLHVHPYERHGEPAHPEVGLFTEQAYDPAHWRPNYVNDQVMSCDRADAFWAGTVLAKIDDVMIDAACTAGRYPSPAAEAELARVLKARRDMTLDWALRRVSPAVVLEAVDDGHGGFAVRAGDALTMAGRPSGLTWDVALADGDGALTALGADLPEPSVAIAAAALADRDYVVVRWTARDEIGRTMPPTEGHYLRDDGAWRLVGILRDGR